MKQKSMLKNKKKNKEVDEKNKLFFFKKKKKQEENKETEKELWTKLSALIKVLKDIREHKKKRKKCQSLYLRLKY